MTKRFKAAFLSFLGVLAFLASTAPAVAGVFVPAVRGGVAGAAADLPWAPYVDVTVGALSVDAFGAVDRFRLFGSVGEDGLFHVDTELAGDGWSIDSLSMTADPDPFIAYGLAATNFSGSPVSFLFAFFSPYVGGPYNALGSSHSSSVTDSGAAPNGSVTVSPTDPSGFVHVPHVDGLGAPGANLGLGCSVSPGIGGSGVCDAGALVLTGVGPTPVSGFFDVFVGFTLSPRDIYTGNGRIDLGSVVVPEPAVLSLFGVGLAVLAVVRRRRA